ncbi:hypothetical protein NLG97_g4801 [Lecanicillium saksenae]|uniref:Uncharacterized protein n=1 Tax=Lecanicillium saksenae TaxID=468837 RepID=A0ACC1QY58_9HYPO|nr:hypothetical protein NLG97_g4801 [Lecanicillium saksenae]
MIFFPVIAVFCLGLGTCFASTPPSGTSRNASSESWWLPNIQRQGKVPYSSTGSSYNIYRNVRDYGAKGDGVTDDTAAINNAFADGGRCGLGCDSSTVTPAMVYFPPGTYVVSAPIHLYYYSQMVGDITNAPTLKAAPSFVGIAVIDADPYQPSHWYTKTNNFFRQVRNFKIDLTAQPSTTGTGIHWQVAQATSLQNIEFFMSTSANTRQQGIYMEDGSGGFMSDLTFHGGAFGAYFGNQQFTTRNLVFDGCQTAIFMNWNWVWTLQNIKIDNSNIGIDMSAGGNSQSVGSVLLLDSVISNTMVGISTAYNPSQVGTNGTLVLDNVDFSSNVSVAVQNSRTKAAVLPGNVNIESWSQGRAYVGSSGKAVQGTRPKVSKPNGLLNNAGKWFTRSKPQYDTVAASRFISVKSAGAKGDGRSDDTAAIQAIFNQARSDQIVYFDHGAYVITDTIKVPKNLKIVGEIWPLIMVGGTKFQDQNNPKPVWQVGQPGDVGNVEIQDLIFETLGPQPGAIIVQWNVAAASQGSAGLWDVHWRIGGSAGTALQSDKCAKTPGQTTTPDPACFGAFLLLHVTAQASIYMENTWLWVADHELDLADHSQVNIYNGRGFLHEAVKPSWLWGTASEHNVLYNYNFNGAQNVFQAAIQTETAYMQGNPDATVPFISNHNFADPGWSRCLGSTCARTWGLRVLNSSNIYIYGAGLYSFFNNYLQDCVDTNNCQDNIIDIQNSHVQLFGINTKASVNIVTLDSAPAASDKDNRNVFGASLASFET